MYFTIHTHKNEVLISATTWVNLENIMLHERSQKPKVTQCKIPFVGWPKSLLGFFRKIVWRNLNEFFLSNLIFEIIGTDKSIEAENRRVVATSQGRREKGGDC